MLINASLSLLRTFIIEPPRAKSIHRQHFRHEERRDTMKEDFEYSLKPAIIWMKLMGIQMNVSGKDRLISRCLVGIIGTLILSINLLCCKGFVIDNYLNHWLNPEVSDRTREERKNELLDRLPDICQLCRFFEHHVLSHLIIFLGSLTSRWKTMWSDLQVIQTRLVLDKKFHRRLRKECFAALGLFISLISTYVFCAIMVQKIFSSRPNVSILILRKIIFPTLGSIPGLSVLILFYILLITARLLFENLDKRITEIIEKSNTDVDRPGDYDELDMSMELDEWRSQYELVSRWIDRLDSCFGFLILVELATFVLYSFYYFWQLLLTYVKVAINMRYDACAIVADIERLIYSKALRNFPRGEHDWHHIVNIMYICRERRDKLLAFMLDLTIDQMLVHWLKVLFILIPISRMRNQDAGLFETFRRFKFRIQDSSLNSQLHNLRLQLVHCSSTVTAAHVVNDLGPSLIPAVLAATIEFGLTLFEISPDHQKLKSAELSLEVLTSFLFANETLMLQVLSSEMVSANKQQTLPYE